MGGSQLLPLCHGNHFRHRGGKSQRLSNLRDEILGTELVFTGHTHASHTYTNLPNTRESSIPGFCASAQIGDRRPLLNQTWARERIFRQKVQQQGWSSSGTCHPDSQPIPWTASAQPSTVPTCCPQSLVCHRQVHTDQLEPGLLLTNLLSWAVHLNDLAQVLHRPWL